MTVPFWITIISYFATRERITLKEFILMILTFICVIVICLDKARMLEEEESALGSPTADESEEEGPTRQDYLIGVAVIILYCIANSICSTCIRMVQDVPPFVLLFYKSLLSLSILAVVLMVQGIENDGLSITEYEGKAFGFLILVAVLQILLMLTRVIAMANERPAFVALSCNVSIVYSFCGDALIFAETITVT